MRKESTTNAMASNAAFSDGEVEDWTTEQVIDWICESVHDGEIPKEIEANVRQHALKGKHLLELSRSDVKDLGYTTIPEIQYFQSRLETVNSSSFDIPSDLVPLLRPDFANEMKVSDHPPIQDETEYWLQVHIMLILRVFVTRIKMELASNTVHKKERRPEESLNKSLSQAQKLLALAEARLTSDTNDDDSWSPLMEKVAAAYDLSKKEALFIQLLVTLKTQPLDGPLHGLLLSFEKPADGSKLHVERQAMICGMSPLEFQIMHQEDRPHCQDRLLVRTEEDYTEEIQLSVSEEVCKAMLRQELNEEERLKLAGTRLLDLLENKSVAIEDKVNGKSISNERKSPSTSASVNDLLKTLSLNVTAKPEDDMPVDKELLEGSSTDSVEFITKQDAESDTLVDALKDVVNTSKPSSVVSSEDRDPRCYTCELDYLNDQFSLVMQQVQIAKLRLVQDLKDASVMDTQPRWMRTSEFGSSKVSTGEMTAKLKLSQRKIKLSLEYTRKEGKFYPRLEGLVDQLGLDSFEKSVLLYLAGSMISPIFKSCIANVFQNNRSMGKSTVGDLLSVFCPTVSDQVASRTYFYRTGKLVRKGLVRVCPVYGVGDLTDNELQLDRRVLDCIVGLDKESTEVVKGGNLYDPNVDLDQVVLPPTLKNAILDTVTYFDAFQMYRKSSNFDEAISYGVGLTLMFCGPSGTGKTMTANAIAAKLGKKLLLVNFPRLYENNNSRMSDSGGSGVQSIFREAELSNAIIFFDECESIFAERGVGGSSQITQLLTELERFDGICFLATNRPFDLDEAMYRRISEVFDFKPPSHLERLEIWRLVTAHEAIPCEESIEWESIALQFEITGGYIKNVVIAALLAAVGRNPSSPMITQADIIDGCKKQMRGALQMVDFDERILPRAGIDELVASDAVKEPLREMVQLEKARGVLFGLWGFSDDMRSRQGTTALFWGPKGCGKTDAAEAVGFELGKALKIVDIPQLLAKRTKGRSDAANTVRDVFKEARLMDAVLVLNGYSLNTEGGDGGHSGGDDSALLNLLVREMARFPGVVIMAVDTPGALDIFVSRLDKGLLSGLKFVLEFALPDMKTRQSLWKSLLPTDVPTGEKIKFLDLARCSEKFTQLQIGNAIYRAAASAALRPEKDRHVKMADLYVAIEDEKRRGESAVDRWVKAQYL